MSELKTVIVDAVMNQGFAIESVIDGHKLVIDQPVAAKGTGLGPTPLQYLLFAIGGCIGTIARIVAFQQKITLHGMKIKVVGEYNPAGLMGRETDERVGFQQISIAAVIDADMTAEQKAHFLELVCQRCPLHDNLSNGTVVTQQLVSEL